MLADKEHQLRREGDVLPPAGGELRGQQAQLRRHIRSVLAREPASTAADRAKVVGRHRRAEPLRVVVPGRLVWPRERTPSATRSSSNPPAVELCHRRSPRSPLSSDGKAKPPGASPSPPRRVAPGRRAPSRPRGSRVPRAAPGCSAQAVNRRASRRRAAGSRAPGAHNRRCGESTAPWSGSSTSKCHTGWSPRIHPGGCLQGRSRSIGSSRMNRHDRARHVPEGGPPSLAGAELGPRALRAAADVRARGLAQVPRLRQVRVVAPFQAEAGPGLLRPVLMLPAQHGVGG